MTVEKQFPSGMWVITNLIRGTLVTRRYMGYTKREAVALFKHDQTPGGRR